MARPSLKLSEKLAILGFGIVLLGWFWPGPLSQVSADGGVTVAPAIANISLSKTEPHQVLSISVRNNFTSPVELTANLAVLALENGRLIPKDQPDQEVAAYTTLTPQQFRLTPNQSINIHLEFNDQDSLAPGGHYAQLLIKSTNPNPQAGIGLQPAISVILYITKEDGAVRALGLSNLTIPKINFVWPTEVNLEFINSGNVLVVPRAQASLNRGPTILSSTAVNQESIPVFSEHRIHLLARFSNQRFQWLPGRYNITVQYRYDGSDDLKLLQQSFWYFPWQTLLVILGLVGLGWRQRNFLRQKLFTRRASPPANKAPKPRSIADIIRPKDLDK